MSDPADFVMYSIGFVHASVCSNLPPEEVVARANHEHHPGTMNGWTLSADTHFHGGAPNPCPCDRHPETHKHYLLDC
jgi:hypothetical protein